MTLFRPGIITTGLRELSICDRVSQDGCGMPGVNGGCVAGYTR